MEDSTSDNCCKPRNYHATNSAGGAVYGLGLIGAAVWFIGQATTFWTGVLGFLKAIVWPAIMAFKLFEFLK